MHNNVSAQLPVKLLTCPHKRAALRLKLAQRHMSCCAHMYAVFPRAASSLLAHVALYDIAAEAFIEELPTGHACIVPERMCSTTCPAAPTCR